ncbi:hypothetical protein CsSME_00042425 [Camellia sinensis var. sinensis]
MNVKNDFLMVISLRRFTCILPLAFTILLDRFVIFGMLCYLFRIFLYLHAKSWVSCYGSRYC